MRVRILLFVMTCLSALNSLAVTQEGHVRTIARPGMSGTPVEGAVIRLQGSHNRVASRQNGDFSLLLHDLQNGQAYTIASIVKSGYEPAEQELIGKRLPCSDQVPLEILLVSKLQLMQEREEIETKARENVEIYYQARIDSLEQLLAAKQISEAEWAKQKQRLERQYENFEPLLQAMSDVLARTDYARMDSLTTLMQQAIENGNPEEAERLLLEKGSIAQRETVLREWGKNIAALQQEVDRNQDAYVRQKRQLEDDCYRMYAACLTRFQNDSAGYYIQKRAPTYPPLADLKSARQFFERAYRLAESQYGVYSGQMATTCNELGMLAKACRKYDEASQWYSQSLKIREKLRGKNSLATAEALNNLGELYRAQKDLKKSMECHKRALKIREKEAGRQSLATAESLNNIAGILFQQQQYGQAQKLFLEVMDIYASSSGVQQSRIAANYNNLAGTYFMLADYTSAARYSDSAVEIYRRVLGENHPLTRNAVNNRELCRQKIQNP